MGSSAASEGRRPISQSTLSDSQPDDLPALPTENYALTTIGLMLASLMQVLDTPIANVALPHMQSSLGATTDSVTWVLTSYMIASAVAGLVARDGHFSEPRIIRDLAGHNRIVQAQRKN